jgi:pentatricopeptide repeat protein
VEQAQAIIDEMRQAGIQETVWSYTLMMGAYSACGRFDWVSAAYEKMLQVCARARVDCPRSRDDGDGAT